MRASPPRRQRERLPLGTLATAALLTATGGFVLFGPGSAQAAQETVRDGSFARPLPDNWTCEGDVRRLDQGQGVEGRPGGYDYAGCTQQVTVKPYTSYDLTADVSGAYAFVGVTGGEAETTYLWANGPERTGLHTVVRTGGTTRTLTVYFHGWYGQGPYQVRRVSLYDSSTGLPACPDMTGTTPSSSPPSPPTPTWSPGSSPSGTPVPTHAPPSITPTLLLPAGSYSPPPGPTFGTTPAPSSSYSPPPGPTFGTTPAPSSSSPTWTGPTCLVPPTAPPSASVSTPAPRPTET
ncbi:hypothetical protein GCM10009759_15040 [Kitasatospora saccharophila]|uniref:Carbohydrate binding protein n=1 Tax=Kitasatospora saccharophila TaxID=407973 RepID=A0ABN2WF08_9ACTN